MIGMGKYVKQILISIIAVYVCVCLTLIINLIINNFDIKLSDYMQTYINYSVPVLSGLFIFPFVLVKIKFMDVGEPVKFKLDYLSICLILIGTVISCYKLFFQGLHLHIIIHTLVIAISEEFLYRYILLNKCENKVMLLISSFIFAFVLHSNEPLIMNLIVRFPIGLILGVIFIKRKELLLCILLHYIYNLVLS